MFNIYFDRSPCIEGLSLTELRRTDELQQCIGVKGLGLPEICCSCKRQDSSRIECLALAKCRLANEL